MLFRISGPTLPAKTVSTTAWSISSTAWRSSSKRRASWKALRRRHHRRRRRRRSARRPPLRPALPTAHFLHLLWDLRASNPRPGPRFPSFADHGSHLRPPPRPPSAYRRYRPSPARAPRASRLPLPHLSPLAAIPTGRSSPPRATRARHRLRRAGAADSRSAS